MDIKNKPKSVMKIYYKLQILPSLSLNLKDYLKFKNIGKP